MQQWWSCCDQSLSGRLLVVERDLLDLEILFSDVYAPGVLYTHFPCLGFWDVCWPIVMRTHGIGLTVVFSHGVFPL